MKAALPDFPVSSPSAWVKRWSDLIPRGGRVLDVASGGGRHTRWFAAAGYTVEAVDRDIGQLAGLADIEAITVCRLDLEAEVWPYSPASFAGIVVTNYLHRPLFPSLLEALAAGGVLIYETFAVGNARYGKPRNPDYLLRPGELREVVAGRLEILGFEEGVVSDPRPAAVQRLCARSPENTAPNGGVLRLAAGSTFIG